ncbi:MAG: NAD(P)H-dependent oxidoreductase subunit E [Desulfuromonadales bacterium]|nr:NAD(P)H-dependent oxidoreductase subunit E [Desulfuromonadales bacterium]
MPTLTSEPTPLSAAAFDRDDPRLRLVEQTLKRFQYRPDALIEVLHVAQETFGFLGDELLTHLAARLQLPESQVFGVATFYHAFVLRPPGKHRCIVCTGTACHVKGADVMVKALEEHFGIQAGQTSADGQLTLGTARCLGICSLAPLLMVDNRVLGHQSLDGIAARVAAALTDSDHSGESTP